MARPNGRPGEGKAAGPPAQVRGPEPGNRPEINRSFGLGTCMGLLVLKGCEDEGGSAGAGWGGVGVWEDGGVGGKHQVWGVRLGRAAGQDGPGLPGCGSGKGDAGRDPQGLSWSPPGVAVCIPSRKSLRQRLIPEIDEAAGSCGINAGGGEDGRIRKMGPLSRKAASVESSAGPTWGPCRVGPM